jgi:hypothetical protein
MAGVFGNYHGLFPPTEGELQEVDISDDETKELRTKGSKCLIGRLGVAKKIHRDSFKAILTRIWRTVGNVFFKELRENMWLFEFAEDIDRKRVLEGRPWSYDRTLLILNELDGQTPPSLMDFSHTPIWMQIHDLPLDCMSRGVGYKIGGSLGKVEDVAISEDDVGWGKYLRIRVAINLYKPLERGRILKLNGKSFWVPFKYEKLPVFCYRCGRIVHDQEGCPEPPQKKHDEKTPWGSWIRAEDLSRGSAIPEGPRPSGSGSPVKAVPAAASTSDNLNFHSKKENTNPAADAHFSATTTPEFSEASSNPNQALQSSPKKERKSETKYGKIPDVRNRKNRDQAFKSKQDSNPKEKTRGNFMGLYSSNKGVKAQQRGINVGQQYRPKSIRTDKEGCGGSDPAASKVPKDQKKGPVPVLSLLKTSCRDTFNKGTKHKAAFGPSSKTSPVVSASSSDLAPPLEKKGELPVVQNVEGQGDCYVNSAGDGVVGGSVKVWKRLARGGDTGQFQQSPNRCLFPVKRGLDEISQDGSDARPEKKERRHAQVTPEIKNLLAEAVEQPRQSP